MNILHYPIEKVILPMNSFLFYLIQLTWGLSINLFSGIAFLIFKIKRYIQERFFNAFITYIPSKKPIGAISLGMFIFASVPEKGHEQYWTYENSVHEYGHCFQALMLGPFYWLVIGIPSFIWAQCFSEYRTKYRVSYYDFYTETWANVLGSKMAKYFNNGC